MKNRDLYLLLFQIDDWQRPTPVGDLPFSAPADESSALALVNMARNSLDAIQQSLESATPQETIRTNTKPLVAEEVVLMSWNLQRIPAGTPACGIPKPGVLIALIRPGREDRRWPLPDGQLDQAAATAKVLADMGPGGHFAGLRHFLTGPGAHADAIPFNPIDVFLSYGSSDSALAQEIGGFLEDNALKVFMAEMSLSPGAMWSEEIRMALQATRTAVLLLTPESVNRPWVMAEAGALWVMKKPFVPATMYVELKKLPEFITERQCIDIRTMDGRFACVSAVKALSSRD